jgi:hypothetical protein
MNSTSFGDFMNPGEFNQKTERIKMPKRGGELGFSKN